MANDAGTPAKSWPIESLSPAPAAFEYTRDVTTSFVGQVTRSAPNTSGWKYVSTTLSSFSVSPGATMTSTHGGDRLDVPRSSR